MIRLCSCHPVRTPPRCQAAHTPATARTSPVTRAGDAVRSSNYRMIDPWPYYCNVLQCSGSSGCKSIVTESAMSSRHHDMMIIGEGHGGTQSNNKLFNVKPVSALVVQSAVSAVCQFRVQCRVRPVVRVSPPLHCSALHRVDTEDTAPVAPPT